MSQTLKIVVGVIGLLLFGITYVMVIKFYKQESEKRFITIVDKNGLDPNHIEVYANVIAVDPIKGEITARLEFEPQGNLKGADGFSLAESITMYVNSVKGKQLETYKKGHRLTPVEVTLNMYGGDASDYPFDQHQADLDLIVTTPSTDKPAPAGEPKPATGSGGGNPEAGPGTGGQKEPPKKDNPSDAEKLAEGDLVPIALSVEASVTGFHLDAIKSAASDKDVDVGYLGTSLSIQRSTTVVGFSIFAMLCMWGLTLGIVGMTISVAFFNRKLEFGMLALMSAMLFAFPAFRNLQPGTPPLGSLTDFLSLFWAQGFIVICLTTSIIVWIKRSANK